MNEIVSSKLRLTPMNQTDWELYVSHVVAAEELFVQYGIEPSDYLVACIQEPAKNVLYYSVVSNDTGKTVGYIGIAPDSRDLEFYIFKEYRRQGYATEAISVFAKEYLNGTVTGKKEESVIAETLRDNAASIALLEKVGFKKQGSGIRTELSDSENSCIGFCVYSYGVQ